LCRLGVPAFTDTNTTPSALLPYCSFGVALALLDIFFLDDIGTRNGRCTVADFLCAC
jgi:hypothetical protein